MINEDPNMGRKQIFTELPLPSKVEEKGILTLIYKGVFIAVKLLLDIRLNLVKISEGKTIKTKYKQVTDRNEKSNTSEPENPIKGLDSIKIENKKEVKTEKPYVAPVEEKEDTKPIPETDSSEKPTAQGEKSDEATNDTNKPKEEK